MRKDGSTARLTESSPRTTRANRLSERSRLRGISSSRRSAPTVFDRGNSGRYCFGDCEADAVDWTGYSGQVLHVEDGPGVSRTRLIWSKHTGHGGTQFAHLYYLAPVNNPKGADSDAWYTSIVDPSVDVEAWKAGERRRAAAAGTTPP